MRRRATIEPVVGHLKDDIGCAVTISKAATETASTPFSPPLVTISPAPALVRGVFTRHVPDCSLHGRLNRTIEDEHWCSLDDIEIGAGARILVGSILALGHLLKAWMTSPKVGELIRDRGTPI
jgi:hypothetical protein